MRRVVLRLLAGVAVVGLVIYGAVTCSAGFSIGSAHCTVAVESPIETARSPGQIVGRVRTSCTDTVESISAVAKLQEYQNGAWVDLVAPGEQTHALPEPNEPYTVRAELTCRQGTFRTAGQAWGSDGGRKSDPSRWEYSTEVTNPCR